MIEYVDELGEVRYLMEPDFQVAYTQYPNFSENCPIIPASDRQPTNLVPYIKKIKDQDGVGQCNAEACVSILETLRVMSGLPYLELSAAYLYGNINGGVDRGSMLQDGINWLHKNGTVPASMVGRLQWRKNTWPQNHAEVAKKYRILEWWWCPNVESVFSALQMGFLVNIGMMWGQGDTPNSDGYLPDRAGRGGGHAIMAHSLCYDNGKWGAHCVNSWSERWGHKGFFKLSETRLRNEQRNFGWFAARVTTQEL